MNDAPRVDGDTFPPSRTLLLCGSQRVGSTLLCDDLNATGVLGHPKESFNPVAVAPSAAAWGVAAELESEDYARAAVRAGTSSNGVFSTKLMWDLVEAGSSPSQIENGGPTLDLPNDLFPEPRAVVLTRRDKLATAASQARAATTGEWSRAVGAAAAAFDADVVPLEVVDRFHELAHRAETGWLDLLERSGIPYRSFVYEDWIGRRPETVRSIANWFGVGPVRIPQHDRFAVQRDQQNDTLMRRWRQVRGVCRHGCTA